LDIYSPYAAESDGAVPSTTMLFPELELPTGARIFPSTLSEYPPCASGGSWGPCATENRRGSAQHHRAWVLDSKWAVEEAEGGSLHEGAGRGRGYEGEGAPRTGRGQEGRTTDGSGRGGGVLDHQRPEGAAVAVGRWAGAGARTRGDEGFLGLREGSTDAGRSVIVGKGRCEGR
jgi:hypothetical protein